MLLKILTDSSGPWKRSRARRSWRGKSRIHSLFASIQEKIAFLPDYSFKSTAVAAQVGKEDQSARLGTSVSGIVGGTFVLVLAFIVGFTLKRFSAKGVH